MKLALFANRHLQSMSLFVVLGVSTLFAHAGSEPLLWSLSADNSKVAYVSIKKETVGELNHFTSISGGISNAGEVEITIDLSSVETNIGIRNERLIKHVFGGDTATATLKANIDLKTLDHLAIGEMKTLDVKGDLSFLAATTNIATTIVVARLSDSRLLVVTDEMIVVKTETLGVNAGIDKLMALASLPSITRVVPVSLRMVFDKK